MTKEQTTDLKRLQNLKSRGNGFISKYQIPNMAAAEFQVFWYEVEQAIRRNDLK